MDISTKREIKCAKCDKYLATVWGDFEKVKIPCRSCGKKNLVYKEKPVKKPMNPTLAKYLNLEQKQ